MRLKLHLPDPDSTLRLGRILSEGLEKMAHPPALLLQGGLGSGKTTLVRGLVERLEGADEAEVSSPSFNILNLYPTRPMVAHFDLYRLEGMGPDETLLEYLTDSSTLVIVEWIEYLDREFWPEEYLHLAWTPVETGRTLYLHAMGMAARGLLESLGPSLEQFTEGVELK